MPVPTSQQNVANESSKYRQDVMGIFMGEKFINASDA
jgi:hypothetical protein